MRKMATTIYALVLLLASLLCSRTARGEGPPPKKDPSGPLVTQSYDANTLRVQGEQRYRTNCGRCHAAPRKFPPRMMATVLRHMRVRATITDEDMRLVLSYMTQ